MTEEYQETGSLLDNIKLIALDRFNLLLLVGIACVVIIILFFIYWLFIKLIRK